MRLSCAPMSYGLRRAHRDPHRGRILNPKTARSQLLGGLICGLGAAPHEEGVVDPRSGAFINRDLAGYRFAACGRAGDRGRRPARRRRLQRQPGRPQGCRRARDLRLGRRDRQRGVQCDRRPGAVFSKRAREDPRRAFGLNERSRSSADPRSREPASLIDFPPSRGCPVSYEWRALRESNPCFRRERAASWTARRRARGLGNRPDV